MKIREQSAPLWVIGVPVWVNDIDEMEVVFKYRMGGGALHNW